MADELELENEEEEQITEVIVDPKSIPEIDSKYRLILLAAQRAKQIQRGAKPRVDLDARKIKPTTIALEEFENNKVNFEFIEKVNGQLIYDIILKETDPELVIHQLDFGNMFGIGARGMDWIKKYPGRFVSVHVKDEIKVPIGEMNDQHESTILGNGLVDPKAVCLLAKAIGGTKQFIIEQESYQGIAPLECARINLERIKTWGLV